MEEELSKIKSKNVEIKKIILKVANDIIIGKNNNAVRLNNVLPFELKSYLINFCEKNKNDLNLI
jgi:hypothetical protein